MRRRFTAAVRTFGVSLTLTGTQKAALDTFYVTTTVEGTTAFDMTDPVEGTTASFRFVAPPTARVAFGGSVATRLWEVELQLEILP